MKAGFQIAECSLSSAKIQNKKVVLQVFPATGNVSGKNREKIGGNREICREKTEINIITEHISYF